MACGPTRLHTGPVAMLAHGLVQRMTRGAGSGRIPPPDTPRNRRYFRADRYIPAAPLLEEAAGYPDNVERTGQRAAGAGAARRGLAPGPRYPRSEDTRAERPDPLRGDPPSHTGGDPGRTRRGGRLRRDLDGARAEGRDQRQVGPH